MSRSEVLMSRSNPKTETRELVSQLGEPFARALAAFVNSLNDDARSLIKNHPSGGGSGLEALLKERLAETMRRNDAEEKAGTLVEFEFTGDSLKESVVHRIKQLMKQRGMNQRDLAAVLKVSPAVISRILNQPNRSPRLD